MTGPAAVVTAAAAIGSGLMGGAYLVFSSFVMQGLAALPPAEGAAAMQSINRAAVRPVFMTMLFAPAVLCVGLVVRAFLGWERPEAPWSFAGAVAYLVGSVVVTAVRNVPMNDALAARDPRADGTAEAWARYLRRWTAWNHVRAVGSVAAAALLTVALVAE